MRNVFLKLCVYAIVLVAGSSLALAKAALPLLVSGPACPGGSARSHAYVVFEDRNGDGNYDWVIRADCDGGVSGREWNPNAQVDPWQPTAQDVQIGQLPVGTINATPTLTTKEEATGLYSWMLVERVPTGVEVCRITRNAEMVLSCSCPVDGEDNLN